MGRVILSYIACQAVIKNLFYLELTRYTPTWVSCDQSCIFQSILSPRENWPDTLENITSTSELQSFMSLSGQYSRAIYRLYILVVEFIGHWYIVDFDTVHFQDYNCINTVHNLLQHISRLGEQTSNRAIKETDKPLFVVFTQLFFWNTHMYMKPGETKSKRNIGYPIKTVDLI